MFKDIVRECRSYRRFDEKHKVSRKVLRELVALARFSPCARNQQALKFMLSCDPRKNDLIFPALKWAGYLKDWKGPKAGERPAAYIIILGDREISKDFGCDHGIAAYSILLGAAEKGLGGCMVGSIDRSMLRKNLKIPECYQILLVVAIGKPAEKVVVENVKKNGCTRYYRDRTGVHHVPKLALKELIIG